MGQFITLTAADGHQLKAYEAGVGNPHKLVVLQEIFGVNHHIRAVCDNFAKEGYHVIAPAMFDRIKKDVELTYDSEDFKAGVEIVTKIPVESSLKDIQAAAEKLGDGKKGIIGYCWGGSLTWEAATTTSIFSAASAWYGAGIPHNKDRKANCPVQMHFGGKDTHIPIEGVKEVEKAHPEETVEVFIYPEAEHGFGCSERSSFNKAAYTLAQERTLKFFKQYL
ncbi:dienelactone hydrolase family protein [Entomobacter blattae]|uniref:Carboxymethylenebutenolidase n=1 Tax=Entomobacter blattae TaxID=2762277 RepID=A0A7H1NRW9_9PROT|nr:dienelactone hydrolase family protein [Entomobacter blattae]QNT78529.1 Carboxymethylenebutenolidase [Entomobacter blattae]